jgi:mannose-6-phosphate isomerase-like protein (cupin superfamily)
MSLHAKAADVKEGENVLQIRGGSMSTKMVYGNDCNLMVATRGAGYHSNPHRHDCEQLNYVMSGEVWVFVDNDAFLMQAGDFSRIPRNALHWAWNRGTEDCVLLEVHAPACDPLVRKNALGLYAEGEKPDLSTAVDTIRTGDSPDAAERKVFGDAI